MIIIIAFSMKPQQQTNINESLCARERARDADGERGKSLGWFAFDIVSNKVRRKRWQWAKISVFGCRTKQCSDLPMAFESAANCACLQNLRWNKKKQPPLQIYSNAKSTAIFSSLDSLSLSFALWTKLILCWHTNALFLTKLLLLYHHSSLWLVMKIRPHSLSVSCLCQCKCVCVFVWFANTNSAKSRLVVVKVRRGLSTFSIRSACTKYNPWSSQIKLLFSIVAYKTEQFLPCAS